MKRIKQERQLVGSFYFRFPDGESGADVFDRATGFIDTLFRSFESHWSQPPQNIVIVTHGLFMRLFLMRYYRKPVEWFHQVRTHKDHEPALSHSCICLCDIIVVVFYACFITCRRGTPAIATFL